MLSEWQRADVTKMFGFTHDAVGLAMLDDPSSLDERIGNVEALTRIFMLFYERMGANQGERFSASVISTVY